MMMKIAATILLAICSSNAFAQSAPNLQPCNATQPLAQGGCLREPSTIVYGYSGDTRTLQWIPDSADVARRAQLFYHVELYTWPAGVRVAAFTTMLGVEQQDWKPARAGLYFVQVNACDGSSCSPWSSSRDPAHTSGGITWILVIAIKPPTGGGIE